VGTTVGAITARNDNGSDATTLTFVIGSVTGAPVIASPTSAVGTVGRPFVTYLITATGLPTSYTATNLPPGLRLNALTGAINGTPTAAGTTFTTLTATNGFGSGTATLTLVIAPATGAPIFTSPTSTTGTVGTPFVTYLITATGQPTAYTATGLPPGLTLNPVTGAINGTPTTAGTSVVTLTATNANGTTTATVTIVISGAASVASSQIVNFAARAISGPGSESLIMGFVVAGEGTNLLVRGIGPSLTPYGVVTPLADPFLTLFNNAGAIATNDDWQTNTAGASNAAALALTAARVGAFPLADGSKDSALLLAINSGAHTTGLVRPNGSTGVALTEIYDIDRKAGTRLINVSARMNVTAGEGTLIAGFVIVGNAPATVLIRGIGPTLSIFGVTGVLADPTISVFAGSARIATNDNWSTETAPATAITQASARSGAFALPVGSKDAALLLTLQPGTYTVQVTGVAATTGVALIEIYDTL
jgi:PKD repeat protein